MKNQTRIGFLLFVLVVPINGSASESCAKIFKTPSGGFNSQSLDRRSSQGPNDSTSLGETPTDLKKLDNKKGPHPFYSFTPQRVIDGDFSFLPPDVQLAIYRKQNPDGTVQRFLVEESLIPVHGGKRVRRQKVSIDESLIQQSGNPFNLVIDAQLESGRNLFRKILGQRVENGKTLGAGVFIFIDVNNLGYINKNFFGKSSDGDRILNDITKILVQTISHSHQRGIVFH